MSPRQTTIKTLEASGYCLKRHGANHDIYYNPDTHSTIPVKRHDFNENDMKYILKEANIIGKHLLFIAFEEVYYVLYLYCYLYTNGDRLWILCKSS